MKNHLLFPFILGFMLFGLTVSAQNVIRQAPCLSLEIQQQADSMKVLFAKQGFMVVKEASMQMVSEYEMPVIVPLTEGSWYQFVFIGEINREPGELHSVKMHSIQRG